MPPSHHFMIESSDGDKPFARRHDPSLTIMEGMAHLRPIVYVRDRGTRSLPDLDEFCPNSNTAISQMNTGQLDHGRKISRRTAVRRRGREGLTNYSIVCIRLLER